MTTSKNTKSKKSTKSNQPTEFFRKRASGGGITKSKRTKAAKAASPKAKKMSGLDAAARVLVESKEPMNAQDLIKAMSSKGYWTSPGGATPHATLHAAMSREIRSGGKDSRFKKAGRG